MSIGEARSSMSYGQLTHALQEIVDHSQVVRINWDRVRRLATSMGPMLRDQSLFLPPWAEPSRYADEFPAANNRDTIQFFFVMVPQGYRHYQVAPDGQVTQWSLQAGGTIREGVHAQYACATRALREGINILDAQYLSEMRLADVATFYEDDRTGQPNIPDLIGRHARFREIGEVLRTRYDGQALNLFLTANGMLFDEVGGGLVQRLVKEFPLSYGDWPFCKLSMTPARMLHDRRETSIPSTEDYLRATTVLDPEHFEAGADVARPFALIRLGVLEIDDAVARRLAQREPIGETYDALRASAMLVCRALSRSTGISSPQLAGELWATGFFRCPRCHPNVSDEELFCPHKATCKAYQHDYSLFNLAPMVGTGD